MKKGWFIFSFNIRQDGWLPFKYKSKPLRTDEVVALLKGYAEGNERKVAHGS